MDASTPLIIGVATYADREDAVHDFKTVWGAKHEGELDHIAVAVLTKDAQGQLEVERHDSTAKHLAWGAALIGAAVAVVAPPVGIGMLVAGGAGAGGIVGHFWHNIPKQDIQEMSQLLEDGQSGLVIVAVDHKDDDITPLLAKAQKKIVVTTVKGDLEAAYEGALKKAAA
jgi:uncharacterized membrane protein